VPCSPSQLPSSRQVPHSRTRRWPRPRTAWPANAVDKKLVGPSYKEVATKYAGQGDAVAKLAGKIQKGGSGVWGPVPMPANTQVSEAEATKLAQWVLSQK